MEKNPQISNTPWSIGTFFSIVLQSRFFPSYNKKQFWFQYCILQTKMVKKTFQGVLEHDLVSYANFNIFYTKLLQNNNLTGPFLSRKFNIQAIQLLQLSFVCCLSKDLSALNLSHLLNKIPFILHKSYKEKY